MSGVYVVEFMREAGDEEWRTWRGLAAYVETDAACFDDIGRREVSNKTLLIISLSPRQ